MPNVFDFAALAVSKLNLPIKLSGDPATVQALEQNTAFPASADGVNTLGQLSFATPSASWDLPGMGAQDISFKGGASTGSFLAAYTDPALLAKQLGFASPAGCPFELSIPATPETRYLALQWTLDAAAAGSGAMALGPAVSDGFAASASVGTRFAFVRAVSASEPVRSACEAALTGWTTPGALSKGAELPAGSWIATEASGRITASLNVKAGYDFNWIKSLQLQEIDGDLGLRITDSLQASLAASLEGHFFVVVSREIDAADTRVRIFRQRSALTDIAVDTAGTVALSTGSLLPGNLDGLLQAMLGVRAPQLLSYLETADMQSILTALGSSFLQKLDASGELAKGFAAMQGLLGKWTALPHAVSTVVWKYASDIAVLGKLQGAAQQLATLDADSAHKLLGSLLAQTSFADDPVCTWLEGAASQSLFSLYEQQGAPLQAMANQLLGVLDGSALQNTLTRLAGEVDTVLDLPTLEAAVGKGDLAGTAQWVQEQLAHFLGIDLNKLSAAELAKLNAVLTRVRGRATEIYAAVTKALNNTYGFSLSAAYNASSEQSALIDASFAPEAKMHLAEALRGRFDSILAEPLPGVTVNVATLTHTLSRHSHVEVHLPWWTGASDDLATGSASARFVDGVDGRVQFFQASASDVSTVTRQNNASRFASCSIGLSGLAPAVRRYNVQAVNFGFRYVTVAANMTAAQFSYAFGTAAQVYFPATFSAPGSFAAWTAALGTATPAAAGNPAKLGTIWADLQVNVRPAGDTDWISRLLNGASPDYWAMSCSMQSSIRFWLLQSYGSDPKRFTNIASTQSFLVYVSLPALNAVTLDGSGNLRPAQPGHGDLVWDTLDKDLVRAVCGHYGMALLPARMDAIGATLLGIPELAKSAPFYTGQALKTLQTVMSSNSAFGLDAVVRYLQAEKTVIDSAKKAFDGLRKGGAKSLQHALPAFASALIKLVETFNHDLNGLALAAPEVMQNFAPLVLRQAIQDMYGDTLEFDVDAMFDVAILKSPALPADAGEPGPDDTLRRARVLTPAAPPLRTS